MTKFTNNNYGANPDKMIYSAILFEDCIAMPLGINFATEKYLLIGCDDNWETYYRITTPDTSDISYARSTSFNAYEDDVLRNLLQWRRLACTL